MVNTKQQTSTCRNIRMLCCDQRRPAQLAQMKEKRGKVGPTESVAGIARANSTRILTALLLVQGDQSESSIGASMSTSEPNDGGTVFSLPRRYWYLDLVVVAAMVAVAYAIIFFL